MTRSKWIGVIAIAGSFVALVFWAAGDTARVEVTTAPVTSGPINRVIVATGTLQAVTTVDVGSQVSGNIQELDADFNSIVKKGQVIARLDLSSLAQASESQPEQAHAKSGTSVDLTEPAWILDAQQKYSRAKRWPISSSSCRAISTQPRLPSTRRVPARNPSRPPSPRRRRPSELEASVTRINHPSITASSGPSMGS